MASGDNVDVIEVVETSFTGPMQNADDHTRTDRTLDEDNKSTGEKTTALDSTATQHGTVGLKAPTGVSRNKSERERKIGHRRVGVGGEITYKKIQTTQIMGSIQLGIQHAVGGLASKPERDLLMQDFMTVETTNFPSEGSNHTPAHHFSEFKFKNYAPIAFRYFRDLFGIQPDDFLMSMCSAPLRELSNPGASGSIFYLTEDDEFIIKTVQHKEGEFLQTLLPGYYMNLNQNPRTLLPKFFGLYCYRCNSKNVRLIAMNNLLPSAVKLHQKYDLKGSTYKRKASKSERSKSSPTYKDLDFMEHHPEGIFLEADTYNALVKTIQRDCRVLESFKIMDYSLLVGIHNLDQGAREKAQEQRLSASADEELEMGNESGGFIQTERDREREDRIGAAALNRSRSINRQRLVAHSTAMESIQAESEPIDEEDDVPPGGIPARNARGERLLLFLGIIDILQSYRFKKKLEHTWKSMIHDGDTVSVHRPGFYAQRFQDFMAKTVFKKIPSPLKHSPSKRKSITRPLRPLEGDFDSTAVAATGSTTMHATSPTKAVSPTDSSLQSKPIAISSGSIPIATSTPVNLASGLVSPPPLTLSSQQQQQAQQEQAASVKMTSYPAVLKGRSAASPPNPNLVPSGKVPPPVPPRGTIGSRGIRISDDRRGPGTATSTSSMTSSRGEAAIITRQHPLHENTWLLHRPLPDNTLYNTSNASNDTVFFTGTSTAATRTTTIATRPANLSATASNVATSVDALHARASMLVRHRSYSHDTVSTTYESVHEGNSEEWSMDYVDEEFVSVERIEDSYVIKTSSNPIRHRKGLGETELFLEQDTNREEEQGKSKKEGSLAKFANFLNPGSRADLPSYRMSRKDKKHSETYYEMMKRRQREIESTIGTISSLTSRRRSVDKSKVDEKNKKISKQVMSMLRGERKSKDSMKKVEKLEKREKEEKTETASKTSNNGRKDNRLLRRIREKSRKRKRPAPKPSFKKQSREVTSKIDETVDFCEVYEQTPSISEDNERSKIPETTNDESSRREPTEKVLVRVSAWKNDEIQPVHSTSAGKSFFSRLERESMMLKRSESLKKRLAKNEPMIKSSREVRVHASTSKNKNILTVPKKDKEIRTNTEVLSEHVDFRKGFQIFERKSRSRFDGNRSDETYASGTIANLKNVSKTKGIIVGGESESNVSKPVLSDEEYAVYLEKQAKYSERPTVSKPNPSFLHGYGRYFWKK